MIYLILWMLCAGSMYWALRLINGQITRAGILVVGIFAPFIILAATTQQVVQFCYKFLDSDFWNKPI